VFAIHGFEDYAPKDGQILVDLANVIMEYYKDTAFNLGSYELHIVPCANPDGLAEGWTKDGPGRCQVSLGIDINRDFNFNFRTFSDSRNKTSQKPYTSPEAQALRDLVLNGHYEIVLSFHGWENRLKGNSELVDIVNKAYGFTDLTPNYENTRGTFDGWASIFAKSMLIELPPPKSQTIIDDFTNKTIKALNYIFESSQVDLFSKQVFYPLYPFS
jgi:protein MpaA